MLLCMRGQCSHAVALHAWCGEVLPGLRLLPGARLLLQVMRCCTLLLRGASDPHGAAAVVVHVRGRPHRRSQQTELVWVGGGARLGISGGGAQV
jgi:hypothetical protein